MGMPSWGPAVHPLQTGPGRREVKGGRAQAPGVVGQMVAVAEWPPLLPGSSTPPPP